MRNKVEIHSTLKAGNVKAFDFNEIKSEVSERTLQKLGVSVCDEAIREFNRILSDFKGKNVYAMDSNVPLATLPNLSSPVQFLQYWLPQIVRYFTSARKIDNIVGRTIAGNWYDEEIVQTFLELTGTPGVYSDYSNIPLASFNEEFETRSIVRLELGCQTGILEEERAGAMRISSTSEKDRAVAEALAIVMNKIGFYGYNGGANKTYGFFNDPNLPSYVSVPVGTNGDTEWVSKNFIEITDDIKLIVGSVVSKCGANFDVYTQDSTLVLPLSCQPYLETMNNLGTQSVKQWLSSTYPKCKVVFAPELDEANGGSNVMYFFADEVLGTKTVDQYVPVAFRLLGVEKKMKGMIKGYSCATAGVMFRTPLAVSRYTGI